MAAATHWAWFDTAIGECAIVWGEAGVRGLMLPGAGRARTLASLRRRHGQAREGELTPAIADAVRRLQALLEGGSDSLESIGLDMDGVPAFHRRVYDAARRIVPGRTCSYGELAEALGEPGAARSVGQALGANPFALIVPCHRVLAAHGASGGFSAPGGVDTKRRLLEIERARIGNQPQLF
ncbi:MAG: methylated-DNA--[protein]-cysteine S-methyltransferase [Piscinibacter sp.]